MGTSVYETSHGVQMPLKVEPLEEPYLNMTPMVDVILNLLIFFMIGSRFVEDERQLDIQLPSVSHAQPLTAPPNDIIINVYADGRLIVDQKRLAPAELENLLSEAHSRFMTFAEHSRHLFEHRGHHVPGRGLVHACTDQLRLDV